QRPTILNRNVGQADPSINSWRRSTSMCGIVGYVGHRTAADYLLEGLRRLEYRGYDSAGIATLSPDGQFDVVKAVGRIDALALKIATLPLAGTTGIGHTRWATHGVPSEANAHPHFGGSSD